jgi:hypothetical protein
VNALAEQLPDGSEQLLLPGLGPVAGECYRNVITGTIVTVLAVNQRRKAWVTIRVLGEQQTLTLAGFTRAFVRI